MSLTEARKNLFHIADSAETPGTYYLLTERGRPKVVLMSAEEFESWHETLEVMNEFPNLSKDIQKAEQEYKKGDYMTLDALLEKEGYVVADKSKRTYGLRSRGSKKGAKRSPKNK